MFFYGVNVLRVLAMRANKTRSSLSPACSESLKMISAMVAYICSLFFLVLLVLAMRTNKTRSSLSLAWSMLAEFPFDSTIKMVCMHVCVRMCFFNGVLVLLVLAMCANTTRASLSHSPSSPLTPQSQWYASLCACSSCG